MKKIKKFLLGNIKTVVAFILGIMISGTTVYAATILFASNQVSYDNTSSGMSATNVQDAIDELYTSASSNIWCKNGYEKQNETPKGYECEIIPICKRATTLHTEACTNTNTTSQCQNYGHALNSTITYGSLGTSGTLSSGDAFDCDVNGDGVYDAATERFYYVSDYFDTNNKAFDSDYATLIYYSSTYNGTASHEYSAVTAYSMYRDDDSPTKAIKQLPTTSQWEDYLLKTTTRNILSSSGVIYKANYSYAGYAARLLNISELYAGCPQASSNTTGPFTDCEYFFENTYFATQYTDGVGSLWIESSTTGGYSVRVFSSTALAWTLYNNQNTIGPSARPVIEIPKTLISY